jgi:hypothetical protein
MRTTMSKVIDGVTVETIDNGHTVTVRRTGSLSCGCTPHTTQMRPMGFHCVTEQQGYCNFECPHEEDE